MKNICFFFLLLGSIFIGCSDNGDNPAGDGTIKFLELPNVDSIWNAYDIIEIYGIGFTSDTELWFRPPGTLGESDQEAIRIGLSAGSIRFRAPRVYGEQEVVLGHEGVKYVIGTLIFSDEPINPIQGIKLPQVDTVWNPGDIITIEGIGFTEESEIRLYTPDSYHTGNGRIVEIYSITAISLSFVAPDNVFGEQEVWLVHGGQDYYLGNLIFAEEKLVYHISKIIQYNANQISEEKFEYDSQNRITTVTTVSWEEENEEDLFSTTIKFEYGDLQIIKEYIISEDIESVSTFYNLNESGLVNRMIYDETEIDYYYEYDGENQVIKIDDYIINWQDSNIKDIEGEVNYAYNYYTYIRNTRLDLSVLIGNFAPLQDKYLFAQGFMGKTNNNLVSRYKLEDGDEYVYEYEFENERVNKVTEYFLNSSGEREERRYWSVEYR